MTTSCLKTMSPHFYIVYFVICIKWSICYEYYDRNANTKRDLKKNVKLRQYQGRNLKLNKDPNAHFDLAGFLNVEDGLSLDGGNYDYNLKSGHNSKEYNDYGPIIENVENINKRDNSPDLYNGAYSRGESNMNPSEFKGLINGRQFNVAELNTNGKSVHNTDDKAITMKLHDELLEDRSLIHNPEKKCSFKNMKFPFFSHNKSQTSKKEKKGKMFCLNCKKQDNLTTSAEPYEIRNKNKRSYIEKLCPECLRKFKAEVREEVDNEKRRLNQRMVHNSRQYFADINNQAKENLELQRLTKVKVDDSSTDAAFSVENGRRKRDDFEQRDRRLKELDQIQRKVDNVEINMPRFEKPIQI